MSIIDKYYNLEGKKVYRHELKKMIRQSQKEGCSEIEKKIRKFLSDNPKEKFFIINEVSKIQQNIENDVLSGIHELSEKEAFELEENEGLGKAVSPNEIYQFITDQIIEVLKSGKDLPWRMPWTSSGVTSDVAINYISKKPYRGINSFMLNYIYPFLRNKKFELPYFLTVNQVDKLGGKMKEGAKAYRVFFFRKIYKKGNEKISEKQYWKYFAKCAKGEVIENGEDVCKILSQYPVVAYYNVFCADDIEGINFEKIKSEFENKFEPIESAEGIVKQMPKRPQLIHRGTQALYQPQADRVVMPSQERFNSPEKYYTTLFHELSHSTKHKKRLNDSSRGGKRFGDKEYAFEELIAELSAVFLCSEAGILFKTLNNSQAYLKSWSKKLISSFEEDNKLFFRASSKAQAAADFILDRDSKGVSAFIRKAKPKIEKKEKPKIKASVKSTPKKQPRRPIPKIKQPQQLELALNGLKSSLMLVGGDKQTSQIGQLGMTTDAKRVAMDLSQTNTISIFGVQGAGKSYSIGTITEMVLKEFENVNRLHSPLAGVIFHYSESMDYAPEFVSMKNANDDQAQLEALKKQYGADPGSVEDIVLLTPKDKVSQRKAEYPSIEVRPIAFNSKELSVQDWMFILGAAGNDSDYIRKLRLIMKDGRDSLTITKIKRNIEKSTLLSAAQKTLAQQKIEFASQYINDRYSLKDVLKPGRLVVVDLRDEFIFKDEALGLFVIMLNIFSAIQEFNGQSFNKFIVFDEAHKYMDNAALTSTIVTAIREMRHKGVSIVIASQDPPSLPNEIIELSSMVLLHKFNSPVWLKHLQKSVTQLSTLKPTDMMSLGTGEAYLWATKSTNGFASGSPVKILTRPRVTKHGGETLQAIRDEKKD